MMYEAGEWRDAFRDVIELLWDFVEDLDMAFILIDELEIGQALAEDLLSSKGQLMLPAGTKLTEKHIRVFKNRGIEEVEVKGEGEEDEELDPEMVQAAKVQITPAFKHNDMDHPMMAQLFNICAETVATKLTAEQKEAESET